MLFIIENIFARQIIDSRGNPTIEVDVKIKNGQWGRASVPSGASTGKYEAIELRDNKKMYLGKSVYQAVNNVNNIIKNKIINKSFTNIKELDSIMMNLDETDNKSILGANAILGVSLATIHAIAKNNEIELYEFLGKNKYTMPIPMMNIINGGQHANNNLDFQEFMIFPIGAKTFSESLMMGCEIFHNLALILKKNNFNTAVGDEGGFAPNLQSNDHCLDLIMEPIESAGYNAGKDIYIALDVAASEFYDQSTNLYSIESENLMLDSMGLIKYYDNLHSKYPIISIEDGMDENDWEGWTSLNKKLGNKIQIVGDDLTVTNPIRLKKAITNKCINSILIKLNQIGSVSETLETINIAKNNNLGAIISHRSGETEDTSIADFAVATNVGQIKTGSLSRTDRIAKYNRLLRIEEKLGKNARFATKKTLGFNLINEKKTFN